MTEGPSPAITIGNYGGQAELQPPLVTVVIASFNYARFIGASIDSLLAQDYPRWEAFILENGSSDDSRDVIARHVGHDPRIKVILNEEQLGQLESFHRAYGNFRGEFIHSLDSDDALQPDFLSQHIQAHLALKRPVAFTSSNIIAIDADGSVKAGSRPSFGRDIPQATLGLRAADAAPRLGTVNDAAYRRLSEAAILMHRSDRFWRWAPGTSNVYRRQVIDYLFASPPPLTRRLAIDSILNPFCHIVAESALIDLPLSLYRIHGANDYSTGVQLSGVHSGMPGSKARDLDDRFWLCEGFLANVSVFRERSSHQQFWSYLDHIATMIPGGRSAYFAHTRFRDLMAKYYPTLKAVYSESALIGALHERMAKGDVDAVLASVYGKAMPEDANRRLRALRWQTFRARFHRKKKK